MGKYFGTDGFRGEANCALTADHAFKVGRFLGWYYCQLKHRAGSDDPARIVIGKDTRRSSYMLEYSLVGGLVASGADAYLLHVTTTPSVAFVTRTDSFDCGIMISASHNPYYDNGIKLINGSGEKMDESVIRLVEAYLDGDLFAFDRHWEELPLAKRTQIGRTVDYVAGRNRYVGYLISLGLYSFKGKKIGLDCANGSSWNIAKSVFDALGAKTYVINAEPDGYNILYICGKYMKETGLLLGNTVVTTVMSNFGLYKAFDELGIDYAKTQVGDKYVYEHMMRNNNRLGGEQSGHIIFSKHASTGDGILTSLMVMEVMMSKKQSLSELCKGFTFYPQVLKSIRVANKANAQEDEDVQAAVAAVAAQLGDTGRILVRESGTEPVIRVMVEAEDADTCEKYVNQVVEVIRRKGHTV